MTPFRKLVKPYRDSGAANSVIAPHRFLDEHCFLTKQGYLGVLLSLPGLDTSCSTDSMIASETDALQRAFSCFDESFRVYQYVLKHEGAQIETAETYHSERVAETVAIRKQFLESRRLFSIDLRIAILYEPTGLGKRNTPSNRKMLRLLARQVERDRQMLMRKTQAFLNQTQSLLKAQLLNKRECFSFFRRLYNVDPAVAESTPLLHDAHIDYFLCEKAVRITGQGIRVGEEALEILTLKDPPKQTEPALFAQLCALPANFILCTEYKVVSRFQARNEIAKSEQNRYWAALLKNPMSVVGMLMNKFSGDGDEQKDVVPDKAALADVEELGALSIALNKNDDLGQFSTTLIFYGKDATSLHQTSAEAIRLFGRYEASIYQETYNAFNAFLSIMPGNSAFNHRRLWLLRSNYVHMALLYARSQGDKRNDFLSAEYLFAAETSDGTPYYLNLHDDDVFGICILGKTGSGKSVFSNTCLDHIQKYNPITFVLDVGESYLNICRKYDGSYMSVGNLDFAVNPFSIEDTKRNRRFLAAFVRLLLSNEGYSVKFEDSRNIFEAIGELYTRDIEYRRLSNLKLANHLWAPMHRWLGDGEYGSVFDNVHDTVTLSHFKVFDFQGIDESPEIAEPLFFYLFMRHEQVVQDPALRTRFKIMWADEVWKFLANQTCRNQFIKAGKTYRKHNSGIALTTQSAFDLKSAGVFELLSEVTPTKILLANQSADFAQYAEMFHLNEKELEQFKALLPKKQFLLKRGENPGQVLNNNLSAYELATYGNSPLANAKRDELIARYGFEQGLKELAALKS